MAEWAPEDLEHLAGWIDTLRGLESSPNWKSEEMRNLAAAWKADRARAEDADRLEAMIDRMAGTIVDKNAELHDLRERVQVLETFIDRMRGLRVMCLGAYLALLDAPAPKEEEQNVHT